MAEAMMERDVKARARKQAESGFSLLEVMISMVILTVGLVSLLGVFGLAMASTQTSQQDMIAKQLANEAYESIVTARNTSQISWDAIQNNSGTQYCTSTPSPCGIFVGIATSPQFQPIYNAGADGIFGTADDSNAGEETLEEPGPDVNNNLITSLRSVTITMQYSTSTTRLPKTYILNSFISQYQ